MRGTVLTLRGVMPALLTPFDERGAVNEPVARELVDRLVAAGVNGFYVCGGTGEGLLLTPAERKRMAEIVVDQVAGRVPVVIHVGAIDTATAVDLAAHARAIGADAVSAIPPFYYALDVAAIKEHYRLIGEAARLPLYIYNIPDATGVAVTPEMLVEFMQMEWLRG
ncbi:MAG TPA: dihydrodipicolinate synthase family protein, partial [Anaerolineae bacterium]|nr:dihydrodipicolinate synthase family protein [Anaerolineae bacterium]